MAAVLNEIPQSIVEQAIAWHLEVSAPPISASVQKKFEAWLAQDILHSKAYQRIERLLQPVGNINIKAANNSIISVLKTERKLRKPQNVRGIAIGITLFFSICFGLQMQSAKIMLADNKAAIGEIKTLDLPDGSRLTMNTNSALDVQFDKHRRIIKLYKGEVFVEVSKDATRPFLVVTEHADARALGTQFNIKIKSESTIVAVVESKVEACNTPSYINVKTLNINQKNCVKLYPSQSVDISNQSLGQVQAIDIYAISSWLTGSVVIDNQPLPEVLMELQRYSAAEIVFTPAKLNHINVSGVLPLNNIPHALAILAGQFNLQVNQADSNHIKVSAQD